MPHELLLGNFAFVSIDDVASASGLSAEDVKELAALGLLEPTSPEQTMYSARAIEIARAAHRLRVDFDLPLAGVALALAYRERIRELEARLHLLECLIPGAKD
jgi:DNA-binding transcriptional MerR regulator